MGKHKGMQDFIEKHDKDTQSHYYYLEQCMYFSLNLPDSYPKQRQNDSKYLLIGIDEQRQQIYYINENGTLNIGFFLILIFQINQK